MNEELKKKRKDWCWKYAMENGRDPQDRIGKNQTANDAYNQCLRDVIELLGEFSEHESYYRLGYDSEKEPGVDKIIEGARGQYSEMIEKLVEK